MRFDARLVSRCAAIIVALCGIVPARAAGQSAPVDLTSLTLESLLEMRITSVSREEQELLRTSAAVYVITQQDIRRSGVSDVAELLRMVPGINVAQVNSNTWAIGARGFNAQYSTKLLVLVDGRSVYDQGFSGVFWHLQNLVLDDIERIEVIRGPGATMWGANAVNGVISITTKRADKTKGALVSAHAGQGRPGDASVRYGGSIGQKASYRVFARQTTRSALKTNLGADGGDSWNGTDAGLRVDWESTARDAFTVQASAGRGVAGDRRQILTSIAPLEYGAAGLTTMSGGHVLGRWTRSFSSRSDVRLQVYYDSRQVTGFGAKTLDTVDVDLQYSFALGTRHHLKWGSGYRHIRDDFKNTLAFGMTPAQQTMGIAGAFVQDEITLVPETLFLTVGSKFEHSSFAGGNMQPAIRAVWQATTQQSLWAASARAVRTENRVEAGMHLSVGGFPTNSLPVLIQMLGKSTARSEEMVAHEIGYRYQVNRRLWFDLAGFYNNYDYLSLVEPGPIFFESTPAPAHLVMPLFFENNGDGSTYGAEVSSLYQVTDALMVKGGFSLLRMDLHSNGSPAAQDLEGQSPRHQGYVGSTLKLPKDVDLSGHMYMVGGLPSFNVPAYTRVDANVFWQATAAAGLKIVGENLLGSHVEFGDLPAPSNAVRRSLRGELVLGF